MPEQDIVRAEHIVSEAADELVRRADCNETATTASFESDADAVTASVGTVSPLYTPSTVSAMSLSVEGTGFPDGGVPFPVS